LAGLSGGPAWAPAECFVGRGAGGFDCAAADRVFFLFAYAGSGMAFTWHHNGGAGACLDGRIT